MFYTSTILYSSSASICLVASEAGIANCKMGMWRFFWDCCQLRTQAIHACGIHLDC